MTYSSNPSLIALIGPTASGKTKLAVHLAKIFNGEIISADSRQVYQGMDLGTGKDLNEYDSIHHHLIDIIHPKNEYNLFNFANDFKHSFNDISKRGKLPFLVGGTGLYLDSVFNRYNLTIANFNQNTRESLEKKSKQELSTLLMQFKPELHNSTDLNDTERLIKAIEIAIAEGQDAPIFSWPELQLVVLGIQIPRNTLKLRITNRLKQRLESGMIEEVESLISSGVSHERLDSFGLEYRFILKYINGELNFNDMYQKLNAAIFKFSKQQEKWFRNFEKKGIKIHWLNHSGDIEQQAQQIISANITL